MQNSTTAKKYIVYTIIGIILVGVLLGVFYFFLIRKTPTGGGGETRQNSIFGRLFGFPEPKSSEEPILPPMPAPPPSSSTTTPSAEPKLLQLTDFSVASMMLNTKQDRILFYQKDGGNMFSYELNKRTKEKISNITIVGIFNVAWNPSQDRRVVSYLDQNTIKSFIHIATSVVTLLPQQIKNPVWSPDGKSLAYLTETNNRTNLITTDSSGKSPKNTFTTPLRDAHVYWISSDKIIFETAPSGVAEGFIFSFSRTRGTFDTLIRGFGIMSKWSPDGTLAFVSKTNQQGKGIMLSIYDSAGNELFNPTIATITEKCFWLTAKKAYCAVPRNIQTDLVWPDDYLKGGVHTSDKLVSLDLEKKEVREIFSEENFDISNLLVTKNETYALFIDRADGTVWSIKLK